MLVTLYDSVCIVDTNMKQIPFKTVDLIVLNLKNIVYISSKWWPNIFLYLVQRETKFSIYFSKTWDPTDRILSATASFNSSIEAVLLYFFYYTSGSGCWTIQYRGRLFPVYFSLDKASQEKIIRIPFRRPCRSCKLRAMRNNPSLRLLCCRGIPGLCGPFVAPSCWEHIDIHNCLYQTLFSKYTRNNVLKYLNKVRWQQ